MKKGIAISPNNIAVVDELEKVLDEAEPEAPRPRVYVTRAGIEIPIRPISAMMIRQIGNDHSAKPKPPVVPSTLPNGKIMYESNENDPVYKAALEQWDTDLNERVIAYAYARGVDMEPSAEDVERLREFLPGVTESRIKFAWICEMIPDDEIKDLFFMIISQNAVTEKGIRDAEGKFPGDDQPD